ncbi:hypothetical protein UA08_08066 [Talaromyces atroroseus]|uniref:Dienelactone hydrolase domain-containing protein n=1 Tax=Talaromyces atroroseus TaxID=1441469 RepID=A0A225ACH1_TALAT|nr:hypothetical protein UA08_08066 [Talaromyces atroroseus]OKL56573.1 hypothetical protein UA08_08066 [Talaromyces atroroseus]
MASYPPSSCCYQGVKHEGQPVGGILNVGDFEIYTSYPANKSTDYAVLFLTDIFGHKFINNQLIADQFAANGYFTFMPDLFNGDPVPANRPESFDVAEWRKSHTTAHVTPIVEASIKELREKYHVKKIAAVGYCYGAKYVVRHLKAGQIDVGYVAHPSHVDADELKAIQGPLSIAAAETDSLFPTEKRHESEEILKNLGVPYQINLYSGVIHGFAVRSDLSVKAAKYAKEAAFFQAIQWFNEYVE